METVVVERTISASRAEVFDWISNAHNYTRVPIVFHEHLAEKGATAPYGLGAVRVLFAAFGWFRERITAYDPPHSFDYHVYLSIPPARHENGHVTLEEVGDGTHVRHLHHIDVTSRHDMNSNATCRTCIPAHRRIAAIFWSAILHPKTY